jgi:outer membrane immunogenic protein
MKSLLMITTAVVALGGTAFAADIPLKAPPQVQQYVSWSGFYLGGHGGVGFSHEDLHLNQNAIDFSYDGSGGFGGGFVGVNWQMGNIVIGAEVEGSAADIGRSNVNCTIPGAQTARCSDKISAFGSVRGRLGMTFGQQGGALLYVAGGWATARAEYDRVFLPGGVPFTSGVRDTIEGWVVAGGVEVMLTNNWIGRLQYDHYEFSSNTYLVPALSNVSDTNVKTKLDTVRVGLGYKF